MGSNNTDLVGIKLQLGMEYCPYMYRLYGKVLVACDVEQVPVDTVLSC